MKDIYGYIPGAGPFTLKHCLIMVAMIPVAVFVVLPLLMPTILGEILEFDMGKRNDINKV